MANSRTFLTFYKRGGTGNSVVWLDATTMVNAQYTSKVTEFPVEDGSTATDHVVNENIKLTVEGQVSNTPVLSVEGNEVDSISATNRVKAAHDILHEVWSSRQFCTVTSDLKTYGNCILQSFTCPRDVEGLDVLKVTLNFIQVRTVNSQTAIEEAVVNQYIKDSSAAPTPVTATPAQRRRVLVGDLPL